MRAALLFLIITVLSFHIQAQNVGIGTTTPADKLEVNGNIRFTGLDTIYAATSATGSGKSVWLRAGYAYVPVGGSGGSIYIDATSNMPSGGSGYGNLGPAGTINLTAGSGYNSAGGNVNITAGQSSYWGLTNDSHSDVILKGGFNINATDAATMTTEGGHIISLNSSTSNGGNLLLKPGSGAGGGTNGVIKLDGATVLGQSLNLAGGPAASPVLLTNTNTLITLLPANATDAYYRLPAASANPGRTFIIRNNSSSISIALDSVSGSLVGSNSNASLGVLILNQASSPKTIMAISDGTNWIIMVQN